MLFINLNLFITEQELPSLLQNGQLENRRAESKGKRASIAISWMFPFVLNGLDLSLQSAWLSGCTLIAQFQILELNILWNYLITRQMSITWIAFSKERGYKKRNYNLR